MDWPISDVHSQCAGESLMDDHFWPSLYPGLIVGALVGLADGSIWSTLLGAAAGLGGAFAAFYVVTQMAIEPGLIPLIAIILGASLAAKACTVLLQRVMRRGAADGG
jgi:hypothetical protein